MTADSRTLRDDADRIWLSVLAGEAVDPALAARVRAETWGAVQSAFLTTPPPREYKTDQADALARDTGLTLAAPETLQDDGFDPPYWIEKHPDLRRRHGAQAARDQRLALGAAVGRLQDAMLTEGALTLRSPFDGAVRRSTASMVMDFRRAEGLRAAGAQTAYLFTDGPPLVALFGGEEAWPMAWFDPVADVIVRERGFMEIDHFFSYTVAQLRTLVARNPDVVGRYLAGPEPRRRTAWIGSVDYLSTHLFGDLAGLDRLVAHGVEAHVDDLVVAARETFGPIEALFPEIDPSKITRLADPEASVETLNLDLMAANAFTVRPAAGFATLGVVDRIRRRTQETVTPAFAAEMARFGQDRRILFVSLRSQTRRWLREPGEIAAMLTRIAAQAGDLGVVLDGYATDPAGSVSAEVLAAEAGFVATLAEALGPAVPVLVSAGRPLADTLHAALAADAHLSTQGTSCTKAVLIADRPGVVIGPDSFWWDARDYRMGAATCLTLGPGEAVDADPARWPVTDFDLPVAQVEAALNTVIAATGERRGLAARLRAAWRQAATLVLGPT